MKLSAGIDLLKQTYNKWSNHQAPRLGASVAFYTLLSFAPLLVLTAAMLALVFNHQRSEAALIDQAREIIGSRGADVVKGLLASAQKPTSGVLASVIAFATLLFGASGVFTELRDALNMIWDSTPKDDSGWRGIVKQRLFSFGMVLSVGFLLLVSLLLSAGLAFVGKFFGQVVPVPPAILEAVNFLISFVVITVLFGLMYRFVPAAHIPWRDVIIGAIGTSLLFTIGKLLLGLYLGKASVGSAYGAAGSLVAVVVWVYYSAQIFFFGAEFTRVYSDAHASPVKKVEAAAEKPSKAEPVARQPIQTSMPVAAPAPVQLPVASAPAAQQVPVTRPTPAVPMPLRSRPNSGRSLLIAAAIGFVFGRAFIRRAAILDSQPREPRH